MGQPYLALEICELHQQDLTGILIEVEAQLLSQSQVKTAGAAVSKRNAEYMTLLCCFTITRQETDANLCIGNEG